MAERPVYIPVFDDDVLVETRYVEFQWFPGLSVSQKQKSIDALHVSARDKLKVDSVLEISSKSRDDMGVALSAFNLMISSPVSGRAYSVENAFQAAKVFERGGPYVDLLGKTSREAKKDRRLQESGRLVKFISNGREWPLQPTTLFYDWLYINALHRQQELAEQVAGYRAFTDIEFNPKRSINCQAYSVALYISLRERGIISETIGSAEVFKELMERVRVSNANENHLRQPVLFN